MIYEKNITNRRRLFHSSKVQGLSTVEPRETKAYPKLGKVVFASSHAGFAACFGTSWSDEHVRIGVTHGEDSDYPKADMVKSVQLDILDSNKIDLSEPCSMYEIEGMFRYLEYVGGLEQISRVWCKVISETAFESMAEMLRHYKVETIGGT